MTTKPTNSPEWAPSAPSTRIATAAQLEVFRSQGWPARFRQTSGLMNKALAELWEWINWLRRAGAYDDLAEAVADTAAGESFALEPRGVAYEVEAELIGSLAGEPTAVAIDAERFYVAFQTGGIGIIRGYLLSSLGNITTGAQAWVGPGLSGTDLYTKIVSNGTYLAAIFDTEWHVYDCTDGTLVYSGDHTAVIRDVTITADYMMIAGVADATDICAKLIDLSDGSEVDVPSWGASLDAFCCCAVENELFFLAAEADGGSNQIAAVSTPAGVPGLDWQSTVTRAIATGARCTSNGRLVFVHNGDTGGWLVAYSIADGSVAWELGVSATLPELCCDAKDVWLALDDINVMYAIDPTNGYIVRERPYTAAANTTLRPPIAANSQVVLRGTLDTGSLAGLQIIRSGLRVRTWRRESAAPHFSQATPEVL